MSGHSKWNSIKHKKGAADAKRGALFTKLGHAITIATRSGGNDPEMNFSLRLAIDKAKTSNMPKENIERSIKRGAGELGNATLEEITYEGFLPAVVQQNCGTKEGCPSIIPSIIQVLTDNKNRAVSEIKNILEKSGGSIAGPGAVMWMFDRSKSGEFVAKQKIEINNDTKNKIQKLFDILDEHQDVSNYYTNLK